VEYRRREMGMGKLSALGNGKSCEKWEILPKN
jgi:hypothetical protein